MGLLPGGPNRTASRQSLTWLANLQWDYGCARNHCFPFLEADPVCLPHHHASSILQLDTRQSTA
eukprot:6186987-Pleurochrysis_carterae.AAC.2